MVTAPPEEVFAAIRDQPDLDWLTVADRVLPIVPRVRSHPPGYPTPITTMVPPGIVVGFGIDIGPAFLSVNAGLIATWGISVADVSARAVANVHDRAAKLDPRLIIRQNVGDVPTVALQTGLSVGSMLILAPTQLSRLFGLEPRLFITPMRDLVVGLPADVHLEFARWLYCELASLDPNCLGPTAFRFDGRRVMPFSMDIGIFGDAVGMSEPTFHLA